jgi:hypothetical protein
MEGQSKVIRLIFLYKKGQPAGDSPWVCSPPHFLEPTYFLNQYKDMTFFKKKQIY